MQNKDKFDQLKKKLQEKNNELSEAKGQLNALLESAKEEFGTDDLEELKQIMNDLKEECEELKDKKKKLENKIEELLEKIGE